MSLGQSLEEWCRRLCLEICAENKQKKEVALWIVDENGRGLGGDLIGTSWHEYEGEAQSRAIEVSEYCGEPVDYYPVHRGPLSETVTILPPEETEE